MATGQVSKPPATAAAGPKTTAPGHGPPRSVKGVIVTMVFWNGIFPDVKTKFARIKEPKGRSIEYNIRNKDNWDDIYGALEAARKHYTAKTGYGGRLRKVWRKAADNIQPLIEGAKFVPDIDYVTPVLGAVEVLLDAVKTAADARKEILEGFDDLDPVFSDVERFLTTFPKALNIRNASIDLIVRVLVAIERGIGFFTRSGLIRGLSAVFSGEEYERVLRDNLQAITNGSKDLMQEALKSHIDETHEYSIQTQRLQQQMLERQKQLLESQGRMNKKQDQLGYQQQHIVDQNAIIAREIESINETLQVLIQRHQHERDQLIVQTRKIEEEIREERRKNEDEKRRNDEKNRQQGEVTLPPVLVSTDPSNLNAAWQANAYLEAKSRNPPFVSPAQHFQWANPPLLLRSSPLSPPTPLPHPQPHPQGLCLTKEGLFILLNISDIDIVDLQQIAENKELLATPEDRARSEQIVQNQLFKTWIVSPISARLLVHGDFGGQQRTSALSLFCTTLTHVFRSKSRFVSLVWFCGRHLGSNVSGDSDDSDRYSSDGYDSDDSEGSYSGPCLRMIRKMTKSFIAQLLHQYDFPVLSLNPPTTDLASLQNGDVEELCTLFRWLVRQLPEDVTFFCLVDGIAYYEREEFEDPMLEVLESILALTVDDNVRAAVKLFVTSPRPTDTVRAGFEDEDDKEDFILSMKGLPRLGWAPSEARLQRELGSKSDDEDDEY
ncbi:hypothetical protein F5882DRAFT_471415 [Hyaloscypha sp. PMI_1271]|nr:hypothetical protein F5882DRAFT_471415 [Hyaloscypha sp. PMI_1271]